MIEDHHKDRKTKTFTLRSNDIWYSPSLADIDECATKAHNCHANAACTNTNGGFTCKCKSGFSGDGQNCLGTDLTFQRL